MARYFSPSIILLLLTGIVSLLSLFPFPGLLLMLVGGPWWPIITVNVGFLLLTREALSGRVPRFLIALPVMWFGGYAIAYLGSQIEFRNLGARIGVDNARQNFAFSSAVNDIAIDDENNWELSGLAGEIVSSYNIPVVFQRNSHLKTATHYAYRLGSSSLCMKLLYDKKFRETGGVRSLQKNYKFDAEPCIYYTEENPLKPSIVITSIRSDSGYVLLSSTLNEIRIQGPGNKLLSIKSGYGKTLKWWPSLAIGGFINSGAQKWDYFAGFERSKSNVLRGKDGGELSSSSVVAKALGFSPYMQKKPTI